jgi:DNA-binding response OmpR family regulator
LGINKYFIKPFDIEELLNYIQSVASTIKKAKLIAINNKYEFDKNSKTLYCDGNMVKLTQREKEFIHLLINNPLKVTSTKIIKKTLWGKEMEVTQERVRTFIKRLRQKTSKDLVENISGQGYILSKNDM